MGLETTTYATFLAKLSSGDDPSAWREFCDRYGELIRAFARRRGLQPADCDEILQDVLTSLTKSMPGFTYDPAKGKFRSYLKTVVVHAVYARMSQKRGEIGPSQTETAERARPGAPDEDEAWEAEWRQYHLRRAMQRVELEYSRQDIAAFELYAVQGQGAGVAAETLGLSIDQVHQAKSRILRRICSVIAEQVGEEG